MPSAAILSDPIGALLKAHPQKRCDLGNGETLTYRVFPSSAIRNTEHTLVFVPGFMCDADTFGAVLKLFPQFEDHRIISVNPRGYGGSTNYKSNFSHEENADDVKLLLDKIGFPRAMAMGYSTGGGTVTYLALKYPNIIKAAFLESSIPLNGWNFNLTSEGKPSNKPITTLEEAKKTRDVLNKISGYPSGDAGKFCTFWETLVMEGSIPPKGSPSWRRSYEAALAHTSRLEALVANEWFNVTPVQTPRSAPSLALQKLQVPLIVIHGARDIVIQQKQVRAITELAICCNWAPQGSVSYYEHSGGHCPLLECPMDFVALYRKALEDQLLSRGHSPSESSPADPSKCYHHTQVENVCGYHK